MKNLEKKFGIVQESSGTKKREATEVTSQKSRDTTQQDFVQISLNNNIIT